MKQKKRGALYAAHDESFWSQKPLPKRQDLPLSPFPFMPIPGRGPVFKAKPTKTAKLGRSRKA